MFHFKDGVFFERLADGGVCNFHYKRPIHATEPLKDKEPPPGFKGM